MPQRSIPTPVPLKVLSLALLSAAAAFFLSCTALLAPAGRPAAEAHEDENFQDFLDVPYPTAMTLEKSTLQVFQRRGVLSGTYSLVGPLSPDEIMDYYDRHLTPHGWSTVSEVQTEKEILSVWSKGQKTLILHASKVTLSLGADTRVRVWMGAPHTAGDLGKRVIYRDTSEPGRTWSSTPIRERGGSGSDVSEENI